jgi:hypothetical protein
MAGAGKVQAINHARGLRIHPNTASDVEKFKRAADAELLKTPFSRESDDDVDSAEDEQN